MKVRVARSASADAVRRSHERQTVPSGASLAAETDLSQGEVSRLKAGCSQDWLPHKARVCATIISHENQQPVYP
jgi:hypothetical protein